MSQAVMQIGASDVAWKSPESFTQVLCGIKEGLITGNEVKQL